MQSHVHAQCTCTCTRFKLPLNDSVMHITRTLHVTDIECECLLLSSKHHFTCTHAFHGFHKIDNNYVTSCKSIGTYVAMKADPRNIFS